MLWLSVGFILVTTVLSLWLHILSFIPTSCCTFRANCGEKSHFLAEDLSLLVVKKWCCNCQRLIILLKLFKIQCNDDNDAQALYKRRSNFSFNYEEEEAELLVSIGHHPHQCGSRHEPCDLFSQNGSCSRTDKWQCCSLRMKLYLPFVWGCNPNFHR